jgi:hypothetical protein
VAAHHGATFRPRSPTPCALRRYPDQNELTIMICAGAEPRYLIVGEGSAFKRSLGQSGVCRFSMDPAGAADGAAELRHLRRTSAVDIHVAFSVFEHDEDHRYERLLPFDRTPRGQRHPVVAQDAEQDFGTFAAASRAQRAPGENSCAVDRAEQASTVLRPSCRKSTLISRSISSQEATLHDRIHC